ncbi:MAG TPA: oligosaccharide flippase family protein [Pyrinomonadaceae bacterium]|nr:oligosaccharide flippase family protein [Pyrinomonadaceae bacterium]
MSRTERFLGGVGFGYAYQTVVTLAGLWLTPFLLARLGGYEYGLWLVSLQLLAYLTLVDFGVLALLPRETGYATGRAGGAAEASGLPELIGQSARLVLWQMPVLLLAAAGVWLWMSAQWGELRWPLGLVLLMYVCLYPLRIFQAVLYGLQDHAFAGKASLAAWLAGFLVTVGLVFAGWGLYALAAGWGATQGLTAALTWWRLRRRHRGVLPSRLPALTWAAARERLGRGGWVSVSQVAQLLLAGTDLVIIGKLLGPEAVVPYAVTGKLVLVLGNQPLMLGSVAGPALAEVKAGESRQRISQVATALSQAILIVSGAVVCTVLVSNEGFVNWWVGPGLYGGFWLTAALLSNMLLRHWNVTVGCVVFSFGHEKRLCLTSLADGVVTVGAAAVLTSALGAVGAPLGSILGVCAVSLPLNLAAVLRERGFSKPMLAEALRPWLWRFGAVAAAACLVARNWTPEGFGSLGVAAAAAGLAYLLLMLPAALQDPLGIYVRPHLAPLRLRLSRALRLSNPA